MGTPRRSRFSRHPFGVHTQKRTTVPAATSAMRSCAKWRTTIDAHARSALRPVGFWQRRSSAGSAKKYASNPCMFASSPQKNIHPSPSGATSTAVQRVTPR